MLFQAVGFGLLPDGGSVGGRGGGRGGSMSIIRRGDLLVSNVRGRGGGYGGRGGGGGSRWRGGGGGGVRVSSLNLDRRPRQLLVTGYTAEEHTEVLYHLAVGTLSRISLRYMRKLYHSKLKKIISENFIKIGS